MSKKCFSGMIRCSLQEAEVGQNSSVDVKTMQDKELKNNIFLMEKKKTTIISWFRIFTNRSFCLLLLLLLLVFFFFFASVCLFLFL